MKTAPGPPRVRARSARIRGGAGEIDYRALAEVRYQLRRFLVFSEHAARGAGVEPQQHQLLLALKGLPDGQRPTISSLAERLQLRHHTVVGLVDRLVDAQLLARSRSALDRREILLQITARGEQLLRRLSLVHRAELERTGPAFVDAMATLVAGPKSRRAGPRSAMSSSRTIARARAARFRAAVRGGQRCKPCPNP
jgi:DNA-binding MarR family transcriptional regulator